MAQEPDSISVGEGIEERGKFDCYLAGKERAERRLKTGGSFVGGFFGGVLLGPVGAGFAIIAQSDPTVPSYSLSKMEEGDCQIAYTAGYQEVGKKKKVAALEGGLLGTVTAVFLIVIYNAHFKTTSDN